MSFVGPTLAIASATLGVFLLRQAWARRGGGRSLTLAGWCVLLAGAWLWHLAGMAWDKAIAVATLGPSLIAYLVLIQQAEWRDGRANVTRTRLPSAPEPVSQDTFVRGVNRVVLAGPVALAAALGLTALIALRAPWVEADRLVTAGLVLPIAWSAAAIWATMDARLIRVAVVLIATTLICAGGALL